MKKLLLILALLLPLSAFAAQITVPSASGVGQTLVSTTTGQYLATSTPNFQSFTSSLSAILRALLVNGSTTLQKFTATQATTTQATTTNLAVTSLSSQIPYAFPGGSIGALTVGGGLSLSNGTLLSAVFAWPFTKQGDGYQATSTGMLFTGGFVSNASTTIGGNTNTTGLTIFGGATTTGTFLTLGSTTLQVFAAKAGTTTSATSTDLFTTNFLAFGSTTLQNFFSSRGTTTSATSTNLYTTDFLSIGSSTFQKLFAQQGTTTSATSTNLYTTNFLAIGSSTFQNLTASNATTAQATTTSLYVSSLASTTNLRANSSVFGDITVGSCSGCAGTGSLGQVAYFSGTNVVTGTSTIFIQPTSNLSIGTTTTNLGTWPSRHNVLTRAGRASLGIVIDEILANGQSANNDIYEQGFFSSPTSGALVTVRASIGTDLTSGNYSILTTNTGARDTRLFINQMGNIGIGTTTPQWKLDIASSAPQLALTYGTNVNHWIFSNTGGVLDIATTSPTSFATSSTAFSIDKNGQLTMPFYSQTGCAQFNTSGVLANTGATCGGSMSFAFPFTSFADFGTHNATTSLIGFRNGLYSLASTTIGNNTTASGLTIFGGATTTGQFLNLSSTTLQNFTASNSTSTQATTTSLSLSNNFLTLGSAPAYVGSTTGRMMPFASTSPLDASGFSVSIGTTTYALGSFCSAVRLVSLFGQASTSGASSGGILAKVGTLPSTFSETVLFNQNYAEYSIATNPNIPAHTPIYLEVSKASSTPQTAWVQANFERRGPCTN